MSVNIVRRFVLPLGIGISMVWLVVFGLRSVRAQTGTAQTPSAVAAINRPQDPVVVAGASFPGFSSVPVGDLVLYAYRSGTWTPIPFQIDEVNISGTYVISDGGLLDANDELVFMAGDAGNSVSTTIWPVDTQSRLYPRYVISVTDPLSAGNQAWVYLYRSTTLTGSGVSYVTWNHSAQTAAAISYTAALSPTKFVGLADLVINGTGVDILDRQKIRAEILGGLVKLNEESLIAFSPATLTLPAVGPVRAATNDGDLNAAFYGSRIDFDVSFDLSALGMFLPDFIRTSFDWNNPAATGITTYYDSNTAGGVTINGVPDVVSTTPRIDWFQVNGGASGPGGIVMAIPSVDPSGGSVSNYYKDNGAIDPNDTGDQRSYGDAGLRIDNPGTIISFTLVAYVLPPGRATNVGAAYFARAGNPLASSAAGQCFVSAPDCFKANTTTTSGSSPNPSTFGQSVTFTATLTSGAGTPTGNVTFKDGAATLGTGTLSSGVATFITSTLGVGIHSITAEYSGASNFNASVSAVLTQTVNTKSIVFLPVVMKDWPPSNWVTIISEGFEGSFPGQWDVFDNDGAANGTYFWAKRNCRADTGSYSGWAVGGGMNGAALACGSNYPNNADSGMVYGPFSLVGATDAELNYKQWFNTELNFDVLCALASINGTNFHGWCSSGTSSGAWIDESFDLTSVPTLGNLLGQSNVWVAFIFDTNGSVTRAEGAYVDNIVLRKCTAVTCVGLSADTSVTNEGQIMKTPASMTLER